jgi:uncharacterized cupredoxin-like copper-binding protein
MARLAACATFRESTIKEWHMRTSLVLASLLAAAVTATSALGAAGTSVNVKLKEFEVIPTLKAVKAGKVTFTVTNIGKREHELVVMKTTVAPGKLPLNAKNRVSEKGVVGEAGDVKPGMTKKLTLRLSAGKYQLLCNLPGHYKAGQFVGFTVR